jgi:hypothetical protein
MIVYARKISLEFKIDLCSFYAHNNRVDLSESRFVEGYLQCSCVRRFDRSALASRERDEE